MMSNMANYWANQGKEITLITMSSEDGDFFTLDPRIRRIALGLLSESQTIWAAIKNNVRRIFRLRAAIRRSRPQVVISFMDETNVKVLFATQGLSVPVVISIRNNPRKCNINRKWNLLRRWTYPLAEALVVQTSTTRNWMKEIVRKDRIHVIPNPVVRESVIVSSEFKPSSPFIVAMGRLEKVKGFDLLLRAFSRCKRQDWHLVILGEGSERTYLESLMSRLALGSRVQLPGRLEEPTAVLRQAELFVLSSRHEGFPNGLLEAMSCGLAVVSFDCPTGPSDIITDGIDGVLVPREDVDALAAAMDRLMHDRTERQKLGDRALAVRERFSLENIMGMWDELLVDVID